MIRLDFLSTPPKLPESKPPSIRTVLKDPYETLPRNVSLVGISRDNRFMDPPNGVGPMVEAEPGLRSKSTLPIHSEGKNAQEWWVGLFVSSKGMPSKVISYDVFCLQKKKVLLSPRPTPFEF